MKYKNSLKKRCKYCRFLKNKQYLKIKCIIKKHKVSNK